MIRHLAICLAIAAVTIVSIGSAEADTNAYDAVDGVEVQSSGGQVTVTGIIAGQTTPSTTFYLFGSDERISTCVRLALLAMSKPGKFQFVVVTNNGGSADRCKLSLRTP